MSTRAPDNREQEVATQLRHFATDPVHRMLFVSRTGLQVTDRFSRLNVIGQFLAQYTGPAVHCLCMTPYMAGILLGALRSQLPNAIEHRTEDGHCTLQVSHEAPLVHFHTWYDANHEPNARTLREWLLLPVDEVRIIDQLMVETFEYDKALPLFCSGAPAKTIWFLWPVEERVKESVLCSFTSVNVTPNGLVLSAELAK